MQLIILCGGKGTRSYPYTEYFPKVMMPIRGRPIIMHLMEIYARQGFTNFILAAGHRKEILMDYFHGRVPEWNVQVVDTGESSDTGDRIRLCKDLVQDTFMATYGDGLGNVDLAELVAAHQQSGALATLTSVPLRSQYGTLATDDAGRITEFHEKPVIRDYWINAGYFVFQKAVFDHWQGHNLECDVFPHLARMGAIYTYRHTGFWRSMDTSKDQQELEKLYDGGTPPWLPKSRPSEAARWAVAAQSETNGAGRNGFRNVSLSHSGNSPSEGEESNRL